MKKTLILSAIAVIGAIVFGSASSYANSGKKPSIAHSKAMATVQQDFPHAQNVTWSIEGKNQIALFKEEGREIQCLFNEKGRLESTFITSCDARYLPFELQTSISKKFPGFVAQTITEYITPNRHAFYLLLTIRKGNVVNWVRVKADEDGKAIAVIQELHQNV